MKGFRSCAKTIPKSDQTSTFYRFFGARKKFQNKWSTFYRWADKEFQSTANLHKCSQHFSTKCIVKTLHGIKKGSKQDASNEIQPARGCKWPKWTRKTSDFAKRKKKFKIWKWSEFSSEKSPCVIWCRFQGSWLFISLYLIPVKRTLIN